MPAHNRILKPEEPDTTIATQDRLGLNLGSSGEVKHITTGNTKWEPNVPCGFRVRELGDDSWSDFPGRLTCQRDGINLHAECRPLKLSLEAEYFAREDRIEIFGSIRDDSKKERSVELAYLLPVRDAARWWVDISESVDLRAASAPSRHTTPASKGDYDVWIRAYNVEEESVVVSAAGLVPRDLGMLTHGKHGAPSVRGWHSFLVTGLTENDFVHGEIRLRVRNVRTGSTVYVRAIHLIEPGTRLGTEDEQQGAEPAGSMSLGSWGFSSEQRHRGLEEVLGAVDGQPVTPGSWLEFRIKRGEKRFGYDMTLPAGQLPLTLSSRGRISGLGYPWATVTAKGGSGFTIAMSAELSCSYKFQYDAQSKAVWLILSYGLSSYPRLSELRNKAPFHIILYRTDDRWGFREAAQRYYRLFPELFRRRTDRFGFWYGGKPDTEYDGMEDMYAYLEVHESRLYPRRFLKDRAAWEEYRDSLAEYFPRHSDAGILVLPYRHFYHMSLHVKGDMDGALPHMPADYDEAVHMMETTPLPFGNGYGHHIGDVIRSSAMRTSDGKYNIDFELPKGSVARTGRIIFRTSVSPYLYEDRPEVMTNARSEMEFAEDLPTKFPHVGGIYYDAGAGHGGMDYWPEHLQYAHSPLAPGPGISRIADEYEFCRWVGEKLHSSGKVLMCNGWARMSCAEAWHILGFDIVGIEHPTHADKRLLRFLRTMTYRKPTAFLNFRGGAEAFADCVQDCALYNIWPPAYGRLEHGVLRDAVAPYAGVFQDMYRAGWEPITHAGCTESGLTVERYGPCQGKAYFALYNERNETSAVELEIDVDAIGMKPPISAAELLNLKGDLPTESRSHGKYAIRLEMAGHRLAIVQIQEEARRNE